MAVKSTDAKGCKANAVVTENFDEDDSSTFMVHDAEHVDDADAWYMDGGAIDHMINRLDWFVSFKTILQGQWHVMTADNRRL